jgi:hypothetical protein
MYTFLRILEFQSADQNIQPLMRALAKLVSVNNPDKILFVGEALVGNEAVDQLSKFDRALRDFSGAGGVSKGRGIDGMLVTKWDTVDDKVSFLLSLTRYLDADGSHLAAVGWRGFIHDICDRAANYLRRYRAGTYQRLFLLPGAGRLECK